MKLPNFRPGYLIGAIGLVLLAPFVAYGFSRVVTSGEIPSGVTAAGIDLGGLGEDDALRALLAYEDELGETPAFFKINDLRIQVEPQEFGLDIDEERVLATAFEQRPTSGVLSNFFSWWGGWGKSDVDIPVRVAYDRDEFDGLLATWELEAIANPAYAGSVVVRNGEAEADYPRSGVGIDRREAQTLALEAIATLDRKTVELPTRQLVPELTRDDVDMAVARANLFLTGSITLTSEDPEFELEFTEPDLERAFIIRRDDTATPPAFVMGYSPQPLTLLVTPFREQLEVPPRDAEFVVEDDDTVTLLPSRTGTLIDLELVAETLTEAAETVDRLAPFPFALGALPAFTTEDALAMGPITKVSEFTTQHSAGRGKDRVSNIHLIADTIDGAIVLPGEDFSLNGFVGPRTAEKGYVLAGTIIGGELVDTVGGGVSQFATTFYNAMFFGCYEDVQHKPHSFYFSRYPEVNEATISWPTPQLIFRNDSDALIVLKTAYTNTSITVKFFGNNGGRTCDRELGARFAFRDWKTVYRTAEDVDPDEERRVQTGAEGWSNTVTRVTTLGDGTVERQTWEWTYRPKDEIIEVHECNMPDTEVECPILVPDVLNMTFAAARAELEALGFQVVKGEPVQVFQKRFEDLVSRQIPKADKWVDIGSTITLRIGFFEPAG